MNRSATNYYFFKNKIPLYGKTIDRLAREIAKTNKQKDGGKRSTLNPPLTSNYITKMQHKKKEGSSWLIYRMAQKSKPLPNDQKIVLNRIKACE